MLKKIGGFFRKTKLKAPPPARTRSASTSSAPGSSSTTSSSSSTPSASTSSTPARRGSVDSTRVLAPAVDINISGAVTVGQNVRVNTAEGRIYAVVRWVGTLDDSPAPAAGSTRTPVAVPISAGPLIGVEYATPDGSCDGSVRGRYYFRCAPLHGDFVMRQFVQVLAPGPLPLEPLSPSSERGRQKHKEDGQRAREALNQSVWSVLDTHRENYVMHARNIYKHLTLEREKKRQAKAAAASRRAAARAASLSLSSDAATAAAAGLSPPGDGGRARAKSVPTKAGLASEVPSQPPTMIRPPSEASELAAPPSAMSPAHPLSPGITSLSFIVTPPEPTPAAASSSSSSSSSFSFSGVASDVHARPAAPGGDAWASASHDSSGNNSDDELPLDGPTLSVDAAASGLWDTDLKPFTDPPTLQWVLNLIRHFDRGDLMSTVCLERLLQAVVRVHQHSDNIIRLPRYPKITVVGDLHGQLQDLFYILGHNELPSETNPYLFNGDFVDRGENSCEVLIVLYALKLLYPRHVHLNRGNHESKSQTDEQGFRHEVCRKYGVEMMDLFLDTFAYLPVAHIIQDKVFVVHGGPCVTESLVDLMKVSKFMRVKHDPHDIGFPLGFIEMLWNDPQPEPDFSPSVRNAGYMWGPNRTHEFLATNKFTYVIRSHEMRDPEMLADGYLLEHDGRCLTVFSASRYCGRLDNHGSFAIVRSPDELPELVTFMAESKEDFSPHRAHRNTVIEEDIVDHLKEAIAREYSALLACFSAMDAAQSGYITRQQALNGLQDTLSLRLPFLAYSEGLGLTKVKNRLVPYREWLERIRPVHVSLFPTMPTSPPTPLTPSTPATPATPAVTVAVAVAAAGGATVAPLSSASSVIMTPTSALPVIVFSDPVSPPSLVPSPTSSVATGTVAAAPASATAATSSASTAASLPLDPSDLAAAAISPAAGGAPLTSVMSININSPGSGLSSSASFPSASLFGLSSPTSSSTATSPAPSTSPPYAGVSIEDDASVLPSPPPNTLMPLVTVEAPITPPPPPMHLILTDSGTGGSSAPGAGGGSGSGPSTPIPPSPSGSNAIGDFLYRYRMPLQSYFDHHDHNKTGVITPEEFQEALEELKDALPDPLTEEQIRALVIPFKFLPESNRNYVTLFQGFEFSDPELRPKRKLVAGALSPATPRARDLMRSPSPSSPLRQDHSGPRLLQVPSFSLGASDRPPSPNRDAGGRPPSPDRADRLVAARPSAAAATLLALASQPGAARPPSPSSPGRAAQRPPSPSSPSSSSPRHRRRPSSPSTLAPPLQRRASWSSSAVSSAVAPSLAFNLIAAPFLPSASSSSASSSLVTSPGLTSSSSSTSFSASSPSSGFSSSSVSTLSSSLPPSSPSGTFSPPLLPTNSPASPPSLSSPAVSPAVSPAPAVSVPSSTSTFTSTSSSSASSSAATPAGAGRPSLLFGTGIAPAPLVFGGGGGGRARGSSLTFTPTSSAGAAAATTTTPTGAGGAPIRFASRPSSSSVSSPLTAGSLLSPITFAPSSRAASASVTSPLPFTSGSSTSTTSRSS